MSTSKLSPSSEHEPTWDVAHLFPPQGHWTESEYFGLHSNRMVELADGKLEILPMPTWLHQLIVKFLTGCVEAAAGGKGNVLNAPLPVRLFPRTIREPDVMYFAPGSAPDDPRGYPTRIDLAMEVVSEGPEARRRDYEEKRCDYAQAGVPEYWIVDPEQKQILVLVLMGDEYQPHGTFGPGDIASGKLLNGLRVDVTAMLELARTE